jgi:hypothetical protein
MSNNDTCGTDFVIGGFRYQELKRDEKAGVQLWSATSAYGDINNPSDGYSVTIKQFLSFPFPTDGLHNFEFRKDQPKQAELLFEALVNASAANRPGLGKGYCEDLKRAHAQAQKPMLLPMF